MTAGQAANYIENELAKLFKKPDVATNNPISIDVKPDIIIDDDESKSVISSLWVSSVDDDEGPKKSVCHET